MTGGDIARDILAMAERDQAMRRAAAEDPPAWDADVDRANTERLRAIVTTIGWPTRSRVGEQAEHAAWLLVQHSVHDVSLQKHCLALMRAEPEAEVCAKHLAYLEDRINVLEGQPQRFGTQLRRSPSGAYEPSPLADPAQVDELRRGVGLGPLAE